MSARPVRVALLSSEAVRPTMGGIGVRYLELARRLPERGFDVVLVSPATAAESAACGLPADGVRRFEPGGLAALLDDRDVVVAQGQLANDLVHARPDLPTAIDLYDPWLVENFHYAGTLGLAPYRNDHASWILQLSRGDYFLCSSEEQRLYYLGFLTAVGRVHPERVAADPELAGLIGVVPFGLDAEPPPHRPVLPPRRAGERRLLFGGLYDWYDPGTALDALARLPPAEDVVLFLARNPNPASTPQRLFSEVEAECRRRGWWGSRVRAIDWVPAERRYDLLRDVDALVATHRPGVETDLALRTRFLEALAAGCPAVSSAGGAVARRLREREAGWGVPAGDAAALAAALAEVLAGGERVEARRRRGRELAAEHGWDRVLAPLVAFLSRPAVDASKRQYAVALPTPDPPEGLAARLRRRLARGSRGRA